ncbi:protein adenylyltransferase SelO [Pseudonocardia sp. CA-107938]|uniref:protein adenylyltransferase SelO n=1 Tax=Pseudonocardia sp. CA-107938 TaxID=3240021 RepID=UPI003D8DBB18
MATATGIVAFEHTYARDVPALTVPWTAAPVAEPRLLALNEELAVELGLEPQALREPSGLALLTGNGVPDTVAMAYAGHQFGHYSPRLGDGRALLLGELVDPAGRRRDLHLKGSGRTPFARGGDGYAVVGPMLREYLVSEAMHALGIPTTRSLAVVATGRAVARERLLPGAVLARVAASHIRVGTFQYVAATGDHDLLRSLADHAIARHHPSAAGAANPYLALYEQVVAAQAELIAQWMLVGFVHGVMNTDNMTISGETIDYGPCAFMDAVDPRTVFSSIDTTGRYAYGNQPAIAQWNLARFAETLLPLLTDTTDAAVEVATAALTAFADRYRAALLAGMAAKLGLRSVDQQLVDDLMALLEAGLVDHTSFFRALAAGTARDLFLDRAAFDAWSARWSALQPDTQAMDRVNPVYIPRNHLVEAALDAATSGDLGPFEELLSLVQQPFSVRPGMERYAAAGSGPIVTYCGT